MLNTMATPWQFEQLDPAYGKVTEGPVWNGEFLLFTRIQQSRIMRCDHATGAVTVFRENTNHSNGLAYDAQGRLIACEGGDQENARRVVRYEHDGALTVLCAGFDGKRLNIPNDVVVDARGRIWFTDPFYEGAAGSWSADRTHQDLDHESIFRLDPHDHGASYTAARVTFDTTRPNGLLFSREQRTLYVAQSGRRADEARQLRAYPVNDEDGSLGSARVLHDFGEHRGIDGMRLDAAGNIVATAGWEIGGPGPSIYVFSPDGEVLERHPVPCTRPTNCCFAGPDLSTLYVTTIEGFLFRARTNRHGLPLFPL
ncbi:MAG: SMP-30/gluconolactonase/LRE family protein [Acidobacteria bacterium]|nr:SMP-30/gluconolactonase/LRE family protein [Acidobacteriota bacterium]